MERHSLTRSSARPTDTPPVTAGQHWQDPTATTDERVESLLSAMTIEEKVSQLYGVWVQASSGGGPVAPHQHDMSQEPPAWDEVVKDGLGQLTRPFGTVPVDPTEGRASLARSQREIMAANRFGIPAVAHEECLAGFAAWTATIYPVPLAWGASFDPPLVERMAAQIGRSMRAVGAHQGLAPVLDVVRDTRWGRTEETIGEDPHLVGTVATAYVRGLQSSGIVATLKHFAGYSASRSGRNLAPVSIGPREFADVILPPFEMAVRDGGARSVMHAYNDNDGMPAAADEGLLTGLLRDTWGFEGTVVADYFGVDFLHKLHGIAESPAHAGALALSAGVDVELPTVHCYGDLLVEEVRAGRVPEATVDRAVRRVLRQKCELGMLDPGWSPEGDEDAGIDLDPTEHRALARRLAERSVVLLDNSGAALPLPDAGDNGVADVALIGPLADTEDAMLGCYSFPAHVGRRHPGTETGVAIPTLVSALRDELPGHRITHAEGCSVDGDSVGGFDAATEAARSARVCVVALGDRSDLFGRGTSGEGCDATDLRLPGVQQDLLEALVDTGTPVVAVVSSGRPYVLGPVADRLAAVVQTFLPGEEGGPALAGVLSGRVEPGGRLPVSIPRHPGGQPATYLGAPLAGKSQVSSVDPTPRHPFGHGLSYTDFEWTAPEVEGAPATETAVEVATDGEVTVGCTVHNTGSRTGSEVVQLYLSDPVAQVTQPVRRLIGYARVDLEPGQGSMVRFSVPADLAAYTGLDLRRIVDPGELVLDLAASSADVRHTVRVRLTGPTRVVDHRRRLVCDTHVEPLLGRTPRT
ncbi:beta-xylosidase/alpha-l-arabinosidase [Nocardiopsis sp. NPDC055551]